MSRANIGHVSEDGILKFTILSLLHSEGDEDDFREVNNLVVLITNNFLDTQEIQLDQVLLLTLRTSWKRPVTKSEASLIRRPSAGLVPMRC
ncbi:hypothetical protein AJ80_09115 [Polytolypa hystricis UAMH7299]|uniref:Uncharacterized protein n=1 Tax=Polytolypa hystricis (strain UAMH7299) TaxID=1447883 RepID=A0A2B7WWA8_POLH7|nr:hypothetical protein AJ80_09115 [Polytolypa hystricis UAMH7299]